MTKLERLNAWNGSSDFALFRSAQRYMTASQDAAGSAHASACGAAEEKSEPKPAACGSGCGAAPEDKSEPKPAACGSGCGAAPEEKPESKPSACGAADK